MEKALLINNYPYAWLDEIIEITLNPQQTDLSDIRDDQLRLIETRFKNELREVYRQLKSGTFFLFSSRKLNMIVTHYYDALVTLERQAMVNLAAYAGDRPLAVTGENLLIAIQELKSAITKRYAVSVKNSGKKESPLSGTNILSKIFCKLSVDQIGIILKAADDTKLIIASSLSLIFRSLVPFLSTENSKSISWNSMRKSTYHMEQHDKDIAIEALEKLIATIRGY